MKNWIQKQSQNISLIVVIVILIIVFTMLQPNMLTLFNIKNILVQVSLTAIAGAGMTFAYTAGVFDMSIGSMLALTSIIIAKVVTTWGLFPAILISIAIAVLVGLFNGLIVTKLNIQPFAATLVTMILLRGCAMLMSQGADISLYTFSEVKFISSGSILGVPFPVVLMILVYVIAFFIYYETELGMQMRSVGSNSTSAKISGINTDKIVSIAFVMTALTTVMASFIKTAQVMFGKSSIGEDFPLSIMTVTILGGTLVTGGYGNLAGTLISAILIAVIKNELNINNVNSYYQDLVIGTILVLALVFNGIKTLREERRIKSEGQQ